MTRRGSPAGGTRPPGSGLQSAPRRCGGQASTPVRQAVEAQLLRARGPAAPAASRAAGRLGVEDEGPSWPGSTTATSRRRGSAAPRSPRARGLGAAEVEPLRSPPSGAPSSDHVQETALTSRSASGTRYAHGGEPYSRRHPLCALVVPGPLAHAQPPQRRGALEPHVAGVDDALGRRPLLVLAGLGPQGTAAQANG